MRRALTVTVAALVMSALVLGAAIELSSLADSSVAVIQAETRMAFIRDVSDAFQVSVRASALACLDAFAQSLSIVPPSAEYSAVLEASLASSLHDLSFSSALDLGVGSVSAQVSASADGGLLATLRIGYTVRDGAGDSAAETYSISLRHGLKILSASSLVSSRHASSLSVLSSMEGASLFQLSGLNGSYVDAASGLVVATMLTVKGPGYVELTTSVADSGGCEVLRGGYSYSVEDDSVVPLQWVQ
ncbi:MAG TPA: hypothetical protein VMS77_07005 [Conexivisphaerales archaeon]|nr:hypothetical protein [Conexivisphaerales archaeon]